MSFKPYDQEDIRKIVAARLGSLAAFDPDAIELCARKVASVSGDVRRALQICRRASEVAEERCNRECESRIGSPEPGAARVGTTEIGGAGPMVVMHDVLSAVQDMSNKSNQDNITELPLHGRLVLCILANQNQRTDEGVLEFAALASKHRDLCRKLNLAKLSEEEHDAEQAEMESSAVVSAPVSPASDAADTTEIQKGCVKDLKKDDVDEMLLKYINDSAMAVHNAPSARNDDSKTTSCAFLPRCGLGSVRLFSPNIVYVQTVLSLMTY